MATSSRSDTETTGNGAPRGLLIAGVVLAFLIPPIGLVLAIIARHLDTKAGLPPNVLSTVGIFGGVAMLVLVIILIMAFLVALASLEVAPLQSFELWCELL
ncbi:MAG: hypothetical protein FWG25_01970 [Promicromonosporaceae bacterium]|nr:hypothetical protein [Promicromonosporaceae bacterium]